LNEQVEGRLHGENVTRCGYFFIVTAGNRGRVEVWILPWVIIIQ
jgi:hypothetical protein